MYIKVVYRSIKGFLSNDPMTYAASIAFYTLASMPAILLLAIGVIGDSENLQKNLLSHLNKYFGPNTMSQAQVIIDNATLDYNSIVAKVIGWSILIFSATTVFLSLQNAINKIWSVQMKNNKSGIVKLVIDRVISLAMIASIGFILLVSMVVDSFLSSLSNYLVSQYSEGLIGVFWIINGLLSITVITFIFSLMFMVLPDVKLKWKHVIHGGFVTALLFLVGKYVISIYLSNADVGDAYGASGSLVLFLFWVYYSAIIMLFGAKLTYEYTVEKNEYIQPESYANNVDSSSE